jgi:hypothetical protein
MFISYLLLGSVAPARLRGVRTALTEGGLDLWQGTPKVQAPSIGFLTSRRLESSERRGTAPGCFAEGANLPGSWAEFDECSLTYTEGEKQKNLSEKLRFSPIYSLGCFRAREMRDGWPEKADFILRRNLL